MRAGCGPDELREILSHISRSSAEGTEWSGRLEEIAAFVGSIGRPAAQDYFRAIRETGRVAELTSTQVLEFARSVDPHTAEWYFWAIWGTKAVGELTSDRLLRSTEFFRSMDSQATVEYFLAIRETKAAALLTDERVLAFARALGSEAAVELFGACWETGAVPKLTDDRVLTAARAMGKDAARELFRTVRETKAVDELTSERVLRFTEAHGGSLAREYFRAIRQTRSAGALTEEAVVQFAEAIGESTAREYFRAIGSSNAVATLTSEAVLRAEGVVRSIGADAALDYFLAAAARGSVPPAPAGHGSGPTATSPSAVPVLTLLDLPRYDRYREFGLVGVAVAFWAGVVGWNGLRISSGAGAVDLALLVAAWVGLLYGAHLLLGAVAHRSSEEFLRRRRRLLNENGIRWHDCLASGSRCDLCWSDDAKHEDRRFDLGGCCRCPAC